MTSDPNIREIRLDELSQRLLNKYPLKLVDDSIQKGKNIIDNRNELYRIQK